MPTALDMGISWFGGVWTGNNSNGLDLAVLQLLHIRVFTIIKVESIIYNFYTKILILAGASASD